MLGIGVGTSVQLWTGYLHLTILWKNLTQHDKFTGCLSHGYRKLFVENLGLKYFIFSFIIKSKNQSKKKNLSLNTVKWKK